MPGGLLATDANNPDYGLPSVSVPSAGFLDSRDPGSVCLSAMLAF
jgi:hypothetical protein